MAKRSPTPNLDSSDDEDVGNEETKRVRVKYKKFKGRSSRIITRYDAKRLSLAILSANVGPPWPVSATRKILNLARFVISDYNISCSQLEEALTPDSDDSALSDEEDGGGGGDDEDGAADEHQPKVIFPKAFSAFLERLPPR